MKSSLALAAIISEEGTKEEGRELLCSNDGSFLFDELEGLRNVFTQRFNEIRDKYFVDKDGLGILAGNDYQLIGFSINNQSLKKSSLR